jgi:phytoene dehydrogenase-like protein
MTSSEGAKTVARSYDAVIIGGGHNGLVCATMLAKSGRKVLVVEAADELGGAARTEEFAPGFRVSLAHVLNRLHPEVIKALDLEKHGLALSTAALAPSVALSTDGKPLTLHGAYGERLEGASGSEVRAWEKLRAQLLRYAGIMKPLLTKRPPDLEGMAL